MKDLERYLEEIVEPTIKDLEANRTSVRHMFIACVVVFHSVDYLAYSRKSTKPRQKFGNQSPAFKIVDNVAHAFKHVKTGNPDDPDHFLRYDEVISRPPGVAGVMQAGLSRINDPRGGVTLDKKRDIDLYDVVKTAVAFLRTKLTES
jgi:hypothetical protein